MSSALMRPTARSNGTRSRGAKNAWRGRHRLLVQRAPRGRDARRLAQLAAVLVDRLGQRGRKMAHAGLVVADRQQWHERAPIGALEADAALVERAVDGDAVGQRRAHVDDQLERIARADRGVGRARRRRAAARPRSRRSARAPAPRGRARRRAARCAALLEQRARAVDRGEQARRGARRLEDVEGCVQAVEVEVARVAREQHGARA